MNVHVVIVVTILTSSAASTSAALAAVGNAEASPDRGRVSAEDAGSLVGQGFSLANTQQHQVMQPEPLPPNEPRAKQARAIVEPILKGERAALVELLRAESAPAFATSGEFDKAVDAQLQRLANKGYAIVQLMTGRGADVFVELESATAESTNIVVRFTADAPHRVEGFTQARMVVGR